MSKAYVVTAGEYSDYHIAAVFSTRALADKLVGSINCHKPSSLDHEKYRVEEHDLDPEFPNINSGLVRYTVYMRKDGTSKLDKREPIIDGKEAADSTSFCTDGTLAVCCWAKDEQHAVKIANERRVQLIASDEWQQPAACK